MALCRIKNVEQLKQHNVGELGILIGLDRVPEARCLREKIQQIVVQNKAKEYNTELFNHWLPKNEALFFYIDGHVRIYYGYAASLPVKYISRQKLCLNATTEYWVNDVQGLPYLVFMGALYFAQYKNVQSYLLTWLHCYYEAPVVSLTFTPCSLVGNVRSTLQVYCTILCSEQYN